jgi:hypothetical protein
MPVSSNISAMICAHHGVCSAGFHTTVHVGVLRRNLARDHVALRVSGVAGGPLDHVVRLDDVRSPLRNLLAALLRDDFGEFVGALAEFVVYLPEVLGAVDVGEFAPLLERLLGGCECRVDVGFRPLSERRERLARRGVLALERLRSRALGPLAVDVVRVDVVSWHGSRDTYPPLIAVTVHGRVRPPRPGTESMVSLIIPERQRPV